MTRRIDPRLLEPFVAVAETLHFGHAAERLLTDQSALSRQVARLEAQVGTRLLVRSSRHVQLTEAGRLVLAIGRDVLATARRAAEAARIRESELTVRVHNLNTESPEIHRMLSSFTRARPHVGILLTDGGEPDAQTAILAGTVDVGVVNDFAARPELGWKRFAAIEYGVFSRRDHRFVELGAVRWADFDGEQIFVAPASGPESYNAYLRSQWAAAEVRVDEHPAPANRSVMVVDHLLGGDYLIVLPREVIPPQPALAWTPLDPPWTVQYGISWHPATTNPAVLEMVRWLDRPNAPDRV